MAVGINNFGLVHDIYYPYVGHENHSTSKTLRHRIGVWFNGMYSWLDDSSWVFEHDYEDDTLIGNTKATHHGLQVTLQFRDIVDAEFDVLLRKITITNNADEPRDIRLMLHQVFQISNSRAGDTAQYLPNEKAILNYKGRRTFLVRAENDQGEPFDQFSIGIWGIEGKEGTYRDAEDGELSGNPVEHGNVDSVLRLCYHIPANQSAVAYYWFSAAKDKARAIEISDAIKKSGFEKRFDVTAHHWKEWLLPAAKVSESIPDENRRRHFKRSILLLKSHIDRRGAVIASLDTQMLNYARDAYAYCWPRDAVYAIWPLIRLGYTEEARSFFDFCHATMHAGGYLMHKYQADRALGSSWQSYIQNGVPELPIQEDETAAVVFLIGQYQQMNPHDEAVRQWYTDLVRPMANFLSTYVDHETKLPHASYDLWEMTFLVSTYTIAVTYAALLAAVRLAEAYGYSDDAIRWQSVADDMRVAAKSTLFNENENFFYRGFTLKDGTKTFDEKIDLSSFYGAFMFGLFDTSDDQIQRSYKTIRNTFWQGGAFPGIPRYKYDQYNTVDPATYGNPWFITSFWLAQYFLETDEVKSADEILQWAEQIMLPSGVLSEQINPYNHKFVSVAPLTWSQAEYVSTVLDSLTQPSVA
jgi:GH15 family glucan-1,4-alpha-glucosidase